MIQIDLSQYPTTVRNDLCMALYRMTERHNPRPETDQATDDPKGGERNDERMGTIPHSTVDGLRTSNSSTTKENAPRRLSRRRR